MFEKFNLTSTDDDRRPSYEKVGKRRRAVLDRGYEYIKQRNGERLDYKDFANHLHFSNEKSLYTVLAHLQYEGKIERVGPGTYRVTDKSVPVKASNTFSTTRVSSTDKRYGTGTERIFRAIARSEGKFVTHKDIGAVTDLSQAHVARTIAKLEDQGRIDRVISTPYGSKYVVLDTENVPHDVRKDEPVRDEPVEAEKPEIEVQEDTEETQDTPNESQEKEVSAELDDLNSLAWGYIKEEHDVDLIRFVKWVEDKIRS